MCFVIYSARIAVVEMDLKTSVYTSVATRRKRRDASTTASVVAVPNPLTAELRIPLEGGRLGDKPR